MTGSRKGSNDLIEKKNSDGAKKSSGSDRRKNFARLNQTVAMKKNREHFANEVELSGVISELKQNGKQIRSKIENLINEGEKEGKKNPIVTKSLGSNNFVFCFEDRETLVAPVLLLSNIRPSSLEAIEILSKSASNPMSPKRDQDMRSSPITSRNINNKRPRWCAEQYRSEYVTTENSEFHRNLSRNDHVLSKELNPFDFSIMTSVSFIEPFALSLKDKLEKDLDDEARLELALNVGPQIANIVGTLNEHACIWTDIKSGNILLREDNSIAIADIKAFLPIKKLLVKESRFNVVLSKTKIDSQNGFVYDSLDVFNAKALNENEFLLLPSGIKDGSIIYPIHYRVKSSTGNISSGAITEDELKTMLNLKEYNQFVERIVTMNPPVSLSSKIFEIANKHQNISKTYLPHYLDVTDAFLSQAGLKQRDIKHTNQDSVRTAALEMWEKEYSYQLALILYEIATKISKPNNEPFNFNHPIFIKTDKGKQLANIINRLGHDDPARRISCDEATILMAKMNAVTAERHKRDKPSKSKHPVSADTSPKVKRKVAASESPSPHSRKPDRFHSDPQNHEKLKVPRKRANEMKRHSAPVSSSDKHRTDRLIDNTIFEPAPTSPRSGHDKLKNESPALTKEAGIKNVTSQGFFVRTDLANTPLQEVSEDEAVHDKKSTKDNNKKK